TSPVSSEPDLSRRATLVQSTAGHAAAHGPKRDSRGTTRHGSRKCSSDSRSRMRRSTLATAKAMTPILQRFGGGFRYDFKVAEIVHTATEASINRVFTIHFADRASK